MFNPVVAACLMPSSYRHHWGSKQGRIFSNGVGGMPTPTHKLISAVDSEIEVLTPTSLDQRYVIFSQSNLNPHA